MAAHLVADEQRRVAVVDDRALQPLDLPARARDVLDRQALELVRRRVVGRRDRRQARGREVRVGVDVLERAELRLADRGPAADGQLGELLVAQLAARVAVGVGQLLPHRDHERRAHDRRVVVGGERLVGLVVEQLAPERRRGRPQDRLELAARDPGLRLAGRDVAPVDEHALAAGARARGVEPLDQRVQQLRLLGRVVERDALRVRRWLRGGVARRALPAAVVSRADERDGHGDDGEGDDEHASEHQKSLCRTRPLTSASAASRARFWFCGRSARPARSKTTRRCALTASTLRWISSAIWRFVAGAA